MSDELFKENIAIARANIKKLWGRSGADKSKWVDTDWLVYAADRIEQLEAAIARVRLIREVYSRPAKGGSAALLNPIYWAIVKSIDEALKEV